MNLNFFFLLPCICQAEHNFFDKILKDSRVIPSTDKDTLNNIRGDLGECRQRNLQLTNTLDYILEEMTEIKNKMTRDNEKVEKLEQSISRKFENLQQSFSEVKSTLENYSTLNTNLEEDLVTAVEDNIERLDSLSYWGRWCAYQSAWEYPDHANMIITYEELLTHDNNMNVSSVPFEISSGTFVVPVSGSWKISYNLRSVNLITVVNLLTYHIDIFSNTVN